MLRFSFPAPTLPATEKVPFQKKKKRLGRGTSSHKFSPLQPHHPFPPPSELENKIWIARGCKNESVKRIGAAKKRGECEKNMETENRLSTLCPHHYPLTLLLPPTLFCISVPCIRSSPLSEEACDVAQRFLSACCLPHPSQGARAARTAAHGEAAAEPLAALSDSAYVLDLDTGEGGDCVELDGDRANVRDVDGTVPGDVQPRLGQRLIDALNVPVDRLALRVEDVRANVHRVDRRDCVPAGDDDGHVREHGVVVPELVLHKHTVLVAPHRHPQGQLQVRPRLEAPPQDLSRLPEREGLVLVRLELEQTALLEQLRVQVRVRAEVVVAAVEGRRQLDLRETVLGARYGERHRALDLRCVHHRTVVVEPD
eukprot:Hpha_TRINITY_DN15719_c1_g4::TRINITY_DN15719_c1_g4_i1::g.36757::m.36757